MRKGIFLTLEGPEGSGKSTQTGLLVEFLRRRGYSVVRTREPGGTSIAEAVRRVLLHPSSRIAPMTELLLYEAARAQHIAEVIRPALEKGRVVVCERFTDATEAYQGAGRRLDPGDIRTLNRIATDGLKPDLTLLLDVPVVEGLSRARSIRKKLSRRGKEAHLGDRLERESQTFHRRVRRGYLALARREPRRVRVVRWKAGVDRVHVEIVRVVEEFMNKEPS
jgi:dTMP kinase